MPHNSERPVSVSDLKGGEVLSRQVFDSSRRVLLEKGVPLQGEQIRALQKRGIERIYILFSAENAGKEEKKPDTEAITFVQCDETRVYSREESCLKVDSEQTASIHREIVSFGEKMLRSVLQGKNDFDPEALRENVGQLTEQVRSNPAAMINLAHLKDVDSYTFMHSVNVSILSILLADYTGLNNDAVHNIATGAILHDIGKMQVDQRVLNKPGKLSVEEFTEMQSHTQKGYDILKQQEIPEEIAVIALAHHEKLNGKGYPKSLEDIAIPLPARICAVVDIYDALTADRVYKKAMHPTEAFEILSREAEHGIDARLLEAFHNLMGVYPVSSLVMLHDGSRARVIEQNPMNPARPIVEVLLDRNGKTPNTRIIVDTANDAGRTVAHIYKE